MTIAASFLAVATTLIWFTIHSVAASETSADATQFFCIIEKGPYTGESLSMDLRDSSFSWSIPREETVKIYSKKSDPFEILISNEKTGRGALSLKISKQNGDYSVSGDYGDYGFAGTCQAR